MIQLRCLRNLGILVFVSGSSSSSSLKTGLLLLRSFGTVLVEEFEQLRSRVLVKSVRELGNSRWDLETLVEDNFLALETNVFRPLNETSQVGRRTDVLTCK